MRLIWLVLMTLILIHTASAFAINPALIENVSTAIISLSVNPMYVVNETISVYGTVDVVLPNGTITPIANETVNITLETQAGSALVSGQRNTSNIGAFNISMSAPSTPGSYNIRAKYGRNGSVWENIISIVVTAVQVNEYVITPDKADYYAGGNISVTVTAYKIVSLDRTRMGVNNVDIDGSLRYTNESIISTFNCTTGTTGSCSAVLTAPSTAGTYIIEVNDFLGSTTIAVIPFDVVVNMMDETGSTLQSIFTPNKNATIRVRVTYNGTLPTSGNYGYIGNITNSTGSVIVEGVTGAIDNTTYTSSNLIELNSSFTSGTYIVGLVVTDDDTGNTVSASTSFEVRSWSITLEALSGFIQGLTAYSGASVSFRLIVNNLITGNPITTLTSDNFTVTVESLTGSILATPAVSSNDSSYVFSFSVPTTAGSYTLRTRVLYSGETRETTRTLTVVGSIATAKPADESGDLKELFGGSEYVYIKVEMRNSTDILPIENISLIEVRDEDGNLVNYTEITNWSADDNETREWRANISSAMMKLDNPKAGGLYIATVDVNTGSAVATARFIVDPYTIWAMPRGENDQSGWYGRWQFSPSDTIYFSVTVMRAQHKSGSAMMEFEGGMMPGGGMYTTSAKSPSGDEVRRVIAKDGTIKKDGDIVGGVKIQTMAGQGGTAATPVSGATVEIHKIENDQIFEELPTGEYNYTCTTTDGNGTSTCSVFHVNGSAVKNNWSNGRYHVVFKVTGPDNVTSGLGHSGFEVRSFYIYGDVIDADTGSYKWINKPTDNLTVKVYMYDAGNFNWWNSWYGGTSTGGLNGWVSVEKILYHGSPGQWIWPPVEYEYPETYLNATRKQVSNGHGNFTLPYYPATGWKSGSYTAVLKGQKTNSSGDIVDTDYGDVWFEIRRWEAWSNPVSINNQGQYQWAESFSTDQNVTLFININNAGSWCAGESLGGNVTIGVKSIKDFSSWPPVNVDESQYTVHNITVNQSGNLYSSGWGCSYTMTDEEKQNYILTIEPNGTWDSGWYDVVLDINGSETGWGYFSAIAFYASAQFVNATGDWIWSTTGSGPIYFNITTSKDYFGTDPINTTIDSISLMSWSETSWFPTEYKYPGDLTINQTSVSGGAIIQVNYTENWPSGWYDGQIVMKDANNQTSTAWVWFQAKSFDVYTYTDSWEIGKTNNVTGTIIVSDPSGYYWGGGNALPGTYNITSIVERSWGYMGSTDTAITNYSPTTFTQADANVQTNLTVVPNDGSWTRGYKNLVVTVADENGNTGTGWLSFNVMSFKVDMPEQWSWREYKPRDNVTYNVTITGATSPNISRVYEWVCMYGPCVETEYNTTLNLGVNGTGNFTIYPSPTWASDYHNLNIIFIDEADNSTVEKWVSFEVRPFRVDAWTTSWEIRKNDPVNVSVTLTDIDDVNISRIYETDWSSCTFPTTTIPPSSAVGIAQSQYCDTNYTNYTLNITNGTGMLTINPPDGGWTVGYHNLVVEFMDPSDPASTVTSWIWFQVTPFTLWIDYTYSISKTQNVSINVSMSGISIVNVSRVYETDWSSCYGWPCPEIDYNFTPTQVSDGGTVTLFAPEGGWSNDYYSLNMLFVDPTDASSYVEQWPYFSIAKPFNGWAYPYNTPYENTDVLLYMYVYGPNWMTYQNVTITNVSYSLYDYSTYMYAPYTQANWAVAYLNGTPTGASRIDGWGYINITKPTGNWTVGYYGVKINLTGVVTAETGTVDGYFDIYSGENVSYTEICDNYMDDDYDGYVDCDDPDCFSDSYCTGATTTTTLPTTTTVSYSCNASCYNCYNESDCTVVGPDCVWDNSSYYCYPTSTYTTTTTIAPTGCDNENYTTCGSAYAMTNGVTKANMCGDQQWFSITLNDTGLVSWAMAPTNSDYDLHVKWDGSCSNTTNYDCRPYGGTDQTEYCSNTSLTAGTYYAMADEYSTSGGYYNITVYVNYTGATTTTSTTTTTITGTTTTTTTTTTIEGTTTTTTSTTTTIGVAQVVINEFLPDPSGPEPDEEFIELYNNGTETVDLSGWSLDDIIGGGQNPYTIPNGTTIPSGLWQVFYGSVTSIYLNNAGDNVTLLYPNGTVADQYEYSSTLTNYSIGRYPDGSNIWSNFTTPTPNATNVF